MFENVDGNQPQQPKGKKAALASTMHTPPGGNGQAKDAGSQALSGNGNADNVVPMSSLKEALAGSTASAPGQASVGARPTLAELRAAMGTQPDRTTIDQVAVQYELREPRKEAEYFRTHPDLSLWQEAVMLVDKDGFDKDSFLVSPGMQPRLQRWLKRRLLVPCINQDGEFYIWGITIADILLGQRSTKTEQNNRRIAQDAQTTWVTRVWFKGKHIGVPADEGGVHLGEPDFPKDLTADLILERTLLSRYIADEEHEMAKIYLGTAKR